MVIFRRLIELFQFFVCSNAHSWKERKMKFKSALVGACAIVIGLSVNSFAQAKIIKREVSDNKSTGIYGWYQFNRSNCGAGMVPKYTVKSVEHGKIVGGVEIFELKTRRCKG
jgi:hypothetical protein